MNDVIRCGIVHRPQILLVWHSLPDEVLGWGYLEVPKKPNLNTQ